jgi:hypothetical protein
MPGLSFSVPGGNIESRAGLLFGRLVKATILSRRNFFVKDQIDLDGFQEEAKVPHRCH